MPAVRFDTFYRYADLTRVLHEYAEEFPHLVRLESIGKSHEGRDVWLVTVTSFATGPDNEKPALWVDGNIHATEVSTSSACLYLLHTLTSQFGTDQTITRCLQTRAFYICPRINPDGAEWALADQPKYIRSSTRPHPYDEQPVEGLVEEDIDGDGRMLSMRLEDPTGPWKTAAEDPRLLVRREPTEVGGRYYRLLPEGRIEGYDGALIPVAPPTEGLDLNRNYPGRWRPEAQQRGAGPFAGSEPEVRNVMAFIAAHPNLTGAVDFHTYSGVLLRPFSDQMDEGFAPEDLRVYKVMGEKGTEITGYPAISIHQDFRYHPKEVLSGGSDAYLFEQLGIFLWAVELWSPQRQAGITVGKVFDWWLEHPLADDLALLKWNDEVLGGAAYVDWYPFDHPQLGKVELGGWNMMAAFRNPPLSLVEKEIAAFPEWLVWQALLSPLLEIFQAQATRVGPDRYLVRLVAQNVGWLPSYVSKRALEQKVVRGVVCEITLPAGATLESGKQREERGQLEGRAYTPSAAISIFGADGTTHRLKVEWLVRAPAGSEVGLIARHERAGVARATVLLE
ncbi:MAG TPA: M14 family metallopeptidase [Chloroflexota bacterium]|nr:M14 family metallopeptidase [Chloroflexota bacterium]